MAVATISLFLELSIHWRALISLMDLLKPTNLALGSNYKRLNLILNFLVFGAGAIGSHIGYCAHRAGHSVSLVCRGKHLEAIRKNGLKISIFSNDIKTSIKTLKDSISK